MWTRCKESLKEPVTDHVIAVVQNNSDHKKMNSILELRRRKHADPIIGTWMGSNKVYLHPGSIFALRRPN